MIHEQNTAFHWTLWHLWEFFIAWRPMFWVHGPKVECLNKAWRERHADQWPRWVHASRQMIYLHPVCSSPCNPPKENDGASGPQPSLWYDSSLTQQNPRHKLFAALNLKPKNITRNLKIGASPILCTFLQFTMARFGQLRQCFKLEAGLLVPCIRRANRCPNRQYSPKRLQSMKGVISRHYFNFGPCLWAFF